MAFMPVCFKSTWLYCLCKCKKENNRAYVNEGYLHCSVVYFRLMYALFHSQDNPEDMGTIDSCEYIWEAGVGFAHSPSHSSIHDQNRTELLKLCLTCFSETMYLPPVGELGT